VAIITPLSHPYEKVRQQPTCIQPEVTGTRCKRRGRRDIVR
jgi:hypothetical protein